MGNRILRLVIITLGLSSIAGAQSNVHFYNLWKQSFTTPAVSFDNFGYLRTQSSAVSGGFNLLNSTYANKTNYVTFDITQNKYTVGQNVPIGIFNNSYGVGDNVGIVCTGVSSGGIVALGDEGNGCFDAYLSEDPVVYKGTIASGGAANSTSLTITPTAGSGHQGVGRYLIDTTSVTISTGVITTIGQNAYVDLADTPIYMDSSGVTWPVTGTATTLGTLVGSPGVVTVTPGIMTGISTSTVVYVWDKVNWEAVVVSGTSGGTFTATFRKPHPATAIVSTGGLAGRYIALTADDCWDPPGFFNGGCSASGTTRLRWLLPIIASSSSSRIQVWLGGAQWNTYTGRAVTSAGSNAYTIFEGAEVLSVESSSTPSNTLTLAPNTAAWANSDAVEEQHFPTQSTQGGYLNMAKYLPSTGNASTAWNINMFGIWNGNDTGLFIQNFEPNTDYTGSGGTLISPLAVVNVGGRFNNGLRMQYPPSNTAGEGAMLTASSCPGTTAGCSDQAGIISMTDSGGNRSTLNYSEQNWFLTGILNIFHGAVGPQLTVAGPAVGGNDSGIDWQATNGAPPVTYARINIDVNNATASSEAGALAFQTIAAGTLAERVRILSSGFMGVGTTAPITQLNLSGTGQSTNNYADSGAQGGALLLNDKGGAVDSGGALLFGGLSADTKYFAGLKGLLQDGGNNTKGDLILLTRNAATDSALTERMRILANGNVGVGNTAPSKLLCVGSTCQVSIDTSGNLNLTGGAYESGGTPGAGCGAGSLNIGTMVVTNGLVTHC